jgi:6-phosphofructokinase 1
MGDDFPRDEHGNVKLSEVPLAATIAKGVKQSLAERGVKVNVLTKEVGYELRCVPPSAFDRDYARDLGVGAARALLDGRSGVLITRQAGRCVPIPFDDIIDPATGKTRVRMVDTNSDSYQHARALQDRIEASDLEDDALTAAIAKAANLSADDVRRRYAPLG